MHQTADKESDKGIRADKILSFLISTRRRALSDTESVSPRASQRQTKENKLLEMKSPLDVTELKLKNLDIFLGRHSVGHLNVGRVGNLTGSNEQALP